MLEELYSYKDDGYREFQSKLTPSVDSSLFIGVRVPDIKKIVKKYKGTPEGQKFINELPHKTYDENMLHGYLISEIKDYDLCIEKIDEFLPYVDNWAVCDTMKPVSFKKNKDKLIKKIIKWSKSKETYTYRFAINMLMTHYLDEDFKEEYLLIPLKKVSNEYYVNMMIAWFYATALAKKYDETIKIIESKILTKWVHNKTIQKARESFRITKERKEYLNTLKIK